MILLRPRTDLLATCCIQGKPHSISNIQSFRGMSPASLPSFPESPSTQCFRDSKLLFFVSWVFLHPWFSLHQCMAKFQGSTQMPPFPGSQPGFSSEIPQPLRTSLTLGVSESTAWSTILRVFSWKVVPASRCEGSGEGNGEGGKANTGQTAELATIPGLKELVLGLSAWGSERRPCRYELLPLPGGTCVSWAGSLCSLSLWCQRTTGQEVRGVCPAFTPVSVKLHLWEAGQSLCRAGHWVCWHDRTAKVSWSGIWEVSSTQPSVQPSC